jgi:hypothetical protein
MSLYMLQKAIYQINRNENDLASYRTDPMQYSAAYALNQDEREALVRPDIGLLYVLGVNGQLLMHFAASCGYQWDAYINAMTDGVAKHGPVREGIYAAKEMAR